MIFTVGLDECRPSIVDFKCAMLRVVEQTKARFDFDFMVRQRRQHEIVFFATELNIINRKIEPWQFCLKKCSIKFLRNGTIFWGSDTYMSIHTSLFVNTQLIIKSTYFEEMFCLRKTRDKETNCNAILAFVCVSVLVFCIIIYEPYFNLSWFESFFATVYTQFQWNLHYYCFTNATKLTIPRVARACYESEVLVFVETCFFSLFFWSSGPIMYGAEWLMLQSVTLGNARAFGSVVRKK